ncbi:MAG TPA: LLM class flavin-dependent oxidoreductase, partial [Dehalococcoidia bacterium]|nr:LLM class flavin-dependent oxidoreductase [Dehalococcoidia bacterium]
MEIGVIFPQTEIGADVGAIRDYAQATEDLGFAHIFIADHVLGADTQFHTHPSLANYSQHSVVHESLTLMGYLAAITEKVGLVTGILILPQRQTVLVAKQAAEIDVLSGGRLRLGIGVGWNQVEFEALGQDFHDRGRRSAEQ